MNASQNPDPDSGRGSVESEDLVDVDPAGRSRGVLSVELAVVLLVTWLPTFVVAREMGSPYERVTPSLSYFAWYGGWIALTGYLGWRRAFFRFRRPARALLGDVLRGLAIAVGVLLVGSVYALLSRGVDEPLPSMPASVAAWFALLAVAAVAEECLWRGYALGAMRALGVRVPAAVLATSVLFASYHPYRPADLLGVLAVGVLLGTVRAVGASLVALSLGHAVANAALLLW